MIWNISLNDPWFDYVLTGRKIYEGRRNSELCKKYQVGDYFNIRHHTDASRTPFKAKIIAKREFPTFRHALEALPMEQILPNPTPLSIEEGVAIYLKFVSLQTQINEGVCILTLEV